jgi:hypothetical protein
MPSRITLQRRPARCPTEREPFIGPARYAAEKALGHGRRTT